ncbi:hypothetical protein BM221_004367 [Beauveria bassiana]|uniref:Uncharacterized protein n=1 Tax=Beauveria bassiana TaxID=176275 RepID=A0A2N6NR17_BEABA|nr:hypothetical protein BM221_004367 [Beauveria bassiana]
MGEDVDGQASLEATTRCCRGKLHRSEQIKELWFRSAKKNSAQEPEEPYGGADWKKSEEGSYRA